MRVVLLFMALCHGTTYLGGSDQGTALSANALIQSGATHCRVYLLWRYVQQEVKPPLENITVAWLRANPAAIAAWAAAQDWSETDRRLSLYAQSNITIIGEVTEGTVTGLPKFGESLFDPNVVGEQIYLAYVYRAARATVSRYQQRVHMWQIENELNEAFLASVGGQRRFQLLGSAWRRWVFLTTVLETCRAAVKDADPTALVTMNFHTDVAEWVHDALALPGFYEKAVADWHSLLDVISIDAYPNAFVSAPCESALVAQRVGAAITASKGMPVFVMEWNYPVAAPSNQQLPDVANFSDSRQVACIAATFQAVKAAGGAGVMVFKFAESAGIVPPPGGYSALDLEALKLLRLVMENNDDVLYLLQWLESGVHLQYLRTRLPVLLESFQQGAGLLMLNGTARPGYYELAKMFREW